MKPADFAYHRPEDLREVLALLVELGDEAKLLAGGQSLVPMMNFRLSTPSALIDLNRVEGLAGIGVEDGALVVGAMTRQWDLETSEAARGWPVVGEALALVGHVPTRTRGTVGGSLAHADATAELPIVAVALGADLVVAPGEKPDDRRVVAADDFFQYHFTTVLEPADVLTEVRFPVLPAGGGSAFEEFALRHGDFALVGVGTTVELDERGRCRRARIVLGGVGPRPVRAARAEAIVSGGDLDDESMREAGEAAAAEIEPHDDEQVPAGYRRALARDLTMRALARAADRARASGER